jgi:hypothetical protein
MTYQDKWAGGVLDFGYRECSERYECVRDACRDLFGDRAFHVRDIGANVCYFGLRLTSDFPGCRVSAYENHHGAVRAARKHLANHGNDRLTLADSKVTLDMVSVFDHCDLILAMSVLHHMPEETAVWIDALRGACDHLIVELAMEGKARNSHRRNVLPVGAKIIGHGASHLEKAMRPIVYMEGK